MMVFTKKIFVLFYLVYFCFLVVASQCRAETSSGILVMKIEKPGPASAAGKSQGTVSGNIIYKITPSETGMIFKLSSLSLWGVHVKTSQGDSGWIILELKPNSAKSTYFPETRVIKSQFLLDTPMESIMDSIKPKEGQPGNDGYHSGTKMFAGKLTCILRDEPWIDRSTRKMGGGVSLIIEMEPMEKELAKAAAISGEFRVIDVAIYPIQEWNRLQIKKNETVK